MITPEYAVKYRMLMNQVDVRSPLLWVGRQDKLSREEDRTGVVRWGINE